LPHLRHAQEWRFSARPSLLNFEFFQAVPSVIILYKKKKFWDREKCTHEVYGTSICICDDGQNEHNERKSNANPRYIFRVY
jgi:hypothetical protein